MRTAYIYKITSPSGKIYIGQTINLDKRKTKYKNLHCKGQNKIYNSLIKYGWDNHLFEVIDQFEYKDNKQFLNEREIFWVEFYDSYNNGLNLTMGGDNNIGKIISEETREKLRKSSTNKKHTEETKEKIRIANKGRKLSVDIKEKIQIANIGKVLSDVTKEKIRQSQLLNPSHSNAYSIESGKKLCTKCKIIKDFSEFDKSTKNKDGCRNPCKECRAQERQNPETKKKHNEYNRKRYKEKAQN